MAASGVARLIGREAGPGEGTDRMLVGVLSAFAGQRPPAVLSRLVEDAGGSRLVLAAADRVARAAKKRMSAEDASVCEAAQRVRQACGHLAGVSAETSSAALLEKANAAAAALLAEEEEESRQRAAAAAARMVKGGKKKEGQWRAGQKACGGTAAGAAAGPAVASAGARAASSDASKRATESPLPRSQLVGASSGAAASACAVGKAPAYSPRHDEGTAAVAAAAGAGCRPPEGAGVPPLIAAASHSMGHAASAGGPVASAAATYSAAALPSAGAEAFNRQRQEAQVVPQERGNADVTASRRTAVSTLPLPAAVGPAASAPAAQPMPAYLLPPVSYAQSVIRPQPLVGGVPNSYSGGTSGALAVTRQPPRPYRPPSSSQQQAVAPLPGATVVAHPSNSAATAAGPASAGSNLPNDADECCVCLDRQRTHVLVPCGEASPFIPPPRKLADLLMVCLFDNLCTA